MAETVVSVAIMLLGLTLFFKSLKIVFKVFIILIIIGLVVQLISSFGVNL